MIISALVVGCIAAYYFGFRPGAYAAAATLGLSILAMVLPRYAIFINVGIAVGTFALWRVGSRRPQPAESALAVRAVRKAIKQIRAYVRSR